MEIISSSEEETSRKKIKIINPSIKKKTNSDSEEIVSRNPQRNFRKKISSKVSGKDFFDFNDGFTKVKPSLDTISTDILQDTLVESSLLQQDKLKADSPKSDSDGSITPPPAIFQQEELKSVFSRLKNFKPVQKKTSVISIKPKDSKTLKISVIYKTWPETIDKEIFSESIESQDSFRSLLKKLYILLDQEVVLVFKNTRIYPSSTPKSLEYLGFSDSTPLICYSLLDFNNFQSFLSEKKLELLSDQNTRHDLQEDLQDDESLNIKILDKFGSTLKLAAKEVF